LGKKPECGILAGSQQSHFCDIEGTGSNHFSCPTKTGCSSVELSGIPSNDATDSKNLAFKVDRDGLTV
jgi:hypothetical protein